MYVAHNILAMNAQRQYNISTSNKSKSTEKLSSGYRINRAADDAAGLSISEKMRKQIRGLDRASVNAQDGISAVQTAEGALSEVHNMLQRMNELATQAANGTNSLDDRNAIQNEVEQLNTEIDRVAETTQFNELYLLKGNTTDTQKTYMKGHDAGLKGIMEDNLDTAIFTMDELESGDKVNIAGKNYTIGASRAHAIYVLKQIRDRAYESKKTDSFEINGETYTFRTENGLCLYDPKGTKISYTNVVRAMVPGNTLMYKDRKYTIINDADGNGFDDNDNSLISERRAVEKIISELTAANNIGTDDEHKATVSAKTENGKTTYTIQKGYAITAAKLSFQLHAGSETDMTNKIEVNIEPMSSSYLGIKNLNIKDDSGIAGTYAIDAINDAIEKVSKQRSALGAVQNRLEHTISNVGNIVENTTSAESRIRDTDMAEEMIDYSKNNILIQAGQAMIAQANQLNQGVLSLLQG